MAFVAAALLCFYMGEEPVSFYGAAYPAMYLNNMLERQSEWSPQDRNVFAKRTVEGSEWCIKIANIDLPLTDDKGMSALAKHFPGLAGKTAEFATTKHIARLIEPEFPGRAEVGPDSQGLRKAVSGATIGRLLP